MQTSLPHIFGLLALTCSCCSVAQNLEPALQDFEVEIGELMEGRIASMSLHHLDSVPIKKLIPEKIDERDERRYPSGYLQADQFEPIDKGAVLDITNTYVLLAVKDEFGQQRALSVGLDGTPIESFLLYDNLIYVSTDFCEKEGRRHSPARPYHYNQVNNTFTFSTLFKITAPGPNGELLDPAFHEDETTNERRVVVSPEGRFSLQHLDSVTPNKIEYRHFTLQSSFTLPNTGKVLNAHSREAADTVVSIYADLDASFDFVNRSPLSMDEVIRILPKFPGKVEVFQKQTSILVINGDGDTCELPGAVQESEWEELDLVDDLFVVKKYATDERPVISDWSLQAFKESVRSTCGAYHAQLVDAYTHQVSLSNHVRISKITVKILFTDANEVTSSSLLIFNIATGC